MSARLQIVQVSVSRDGVGHSLVRWKLDASYRHCTRAIVFNMSLDGGLSEKK